MEDNVQGPLLSELANILPDSFKARIKRLGVVNAMDDVNFATAVEATGRKRLIIAGVTNDVCTVYPALSLVNAGFEVQVVADAGGSPSAIADDIALRRMERAGVILTTTNQLLAELAGDWSTPEGTLLVELLVGTLQSPAK
jgi:nicotinamidase-related amidase